MTAHQCQEAGEKPRRRDHAFDPSCGARSNYACRNEYAMRTMNIQPIRGKVAIEQVLYVDLSADHAAVADEAEHRFFMLRAITNALSCATVEPFGKNDQANLCLALNTLIEESNGLYSAAYQSALNTGKQRKVANDTPRE
jgi:hypothetical protein